LPSLANSRLPAKIPALPVLFNTLDVLKFLGINSSIFFHLIYYPELSG